MEIRNCKVCGETDSWLMRRNPRLCTNCNREQVDDKRFFAEWEAVQNQQFISKYWKVADTRFLEEA